jgi:hypothetical protein
MKFILLKIVLLLFNFIFILNYVSEDGIKILMQGK